MHKLTEPQIPYIVAEAPSNLLIKKFSPSKWQARIIVSWGIVLACHCAVTNKQGLYTARFFLGLVGRFSTIAKRFYGGT